MVWWGPPERSQRTPGGAAERRAMKVTTIVRVFTLLSEGLAQARRGAPLRLVTHRWRGLMPRVVVVTRKLARLVQVQRHAQRPLVSGALLVNLTPYGVVGSLHGQCSIRAFGCTSGLFT